MLSDQRHQAFCGCAPSVTQPRAFLLSNMRPSDAQPLRLSWAVLIRVLSAVNAPRMAGNTKGDAPARFSVNGCIESRPFYDADVREDTRGRGGRGGIVLGTPGTRRIVAIFWS